MAVAFGSKGFRTARTHVHLGAPRTIAGSFSVAVDRKSAPFAVAIIAISTQAESYIAVKQDKQYGYGFFHVMNLR